MNYIKRDLSYIDTIVKSGKSLNEKEIETLRIINKVYDQQKEMFDSHKHSVANRIVSLSQPHVHLLLEEKQLIKQNLVLKLKLVLLMVTFVSKN